MRLLYLVMLLIFTSCSYDELNVCQTDNPSFRECVLPIFQKHCVSCHSVGGSHPLILSDFVTISNAINNPEFDLVLRINDDGAAVMPPQGKISVQELQIIDDWIFQGKANN